MELGSTLNKGFAGGKRTLLDHGFQPSSDQNKLERIKNGYKEVYTFSPDKKAWEGEQIPQSNEANGKTLRGRKKNSICGRIDDLLNDWLTKEEIVDKIVEEFDRPVDFVRRYVTDHLRTIRREGYTVIQNKDGTFYVE